MFTRQVNLLGLRIDMELGIKKEHLKTSRENVQIRTSKDTRLILAEFMVFFLRGGTILKKGKFIVKNITCFEVSFFERDIEGPSGVPFKKNTMEKFGCVFHRPSPLGLRYWKDGNRTIRRQV